MSDLKISHLESQIEILQRRLDETQTRAATAEAALKRRTLEMYVRTTAIQAGAVPLAAEDPADDLFAKAIREGQWDLDNPSALLPKVRAWMNDVKKTSPWFFSDAQEQAAKSKDEPPNPWSKKHWNVTKQSRVAAISLDEARRMAKAAGSSLDSTQPPSE